MIQDIENKNFDNQFKNIEPKEQDLVLCFSGKDILLDRNQKDELILPTYGQVTENCEKFEPWLENPFKFAFSLKKS